MGVHIVVAGYIVDHYCLMIDRGVVHIVVAVLFLPLLFDTFNFMCCVLLIIVYTFDHCIVYGSVIDGF